jgi:hypothetical protein
VVPGGSDRRASETESNRFVEKKQKSKANRSRSEVIRVRNGRPATIGSNDNYEEEEVEEEQEEQGSVHEKWFGSDRNDKERARMKELWWERKKGGG